MTAKITIIIPNYNNIKLLVNLIESLKKATTIPYELIIVDDKSEDNSVEYLKKHYPEIKLLVNDVNHGFAYTVNRGIKNAKTDYVYLLNNDTTVDPDFLVDPLKIMESDDEIFAISSKMLQLNNHDLIEDAGDEYTILSWSKKRGYNKPQSRYSQDGEVFSACAGAALYRCDVFDKIGFFDENFGSYVEDMDLSFRAHLYGYKIYYAAHSIVYHIGSASTGSQYNSFKVEISARNNIYLIYKNMPTWMIIINSLFIAVGIIIKYIFFYNKNLHNYYKDGVFKGIKTCRKLEKLEDRSIKNYFKVELDMIKNTFRYLS